MPIPLSRTDPIDVIEFIDVSVTDPFAIDVIWCIFWELDEDEDSLLQKEDLMRYGSYGLSSR